MHLLSCIRGKFFITFTIIICFLRPIPVHAEPQPPPENSQKAVTLGILLAICIIGFFIICACVKRRLTSGKNRIQDINDPEIARAEASMVETLDEAARQNYERARCKFE